MAGARQAGRLCPRDGMGYARCYMFYRVDEGTDTLVLLPMAARRALDLTGLKLSLEGWQSLSLPDRRQLVVQGASDHVDVAAVSALAQAAAPAPEPIAPKLDLEEHAVPEHVLQALGTECPLPPGTWSSLSPLDRYVLAKVCERPREGRVRTAYQQIVGESGLSPHLSPQGGVRMVGVGHKPETERRAVAESFVGMAEATFQRLMQGHVGKGDVLGTARLAGIQGAKRASEWIPLCHPLRLTKIDVHLEPDPTHRRVRVLAEVRAVDRTGVEMEALTAASAASLTIYDMLKAYDRGMQIGPLRLLEKSGGRSGDWRREPV